MSRIILQLRLFLIFVFMINVFGCATLNFSANYYVSPNNYKLEVENLWEDLLKKLPLRYSYTMSIVDDDECKGLKGIPQIQGTHVLLPENLIKYIFQNYFKDRKTILTCTMAHELCHTEYNLMDLSTPQAHFLTDNKAIELLHSNLLTAQDYYRSLFVLKNYWFARKGAGGHALNAGWNLLNVASMVFVGYGYFRDWYATDISRRMQLCVKQYEVKDRGCFQQTHEP